MDLKGSMKRATTLHLNRILKYLIENRSRNDVSSRELYKNLLFSEKSVFLDAIKFLINNRLIRRYHIGDSKAYYYCIIDIFSPLSIKTRKSIESEEYKE